VSDGPILKFAKPKRKLEPPTTVRIRTEAGRLHIDFGDASRRGLSIVVNRPAGPFDATIDLTTGEISGNAFLPPPAPPLRLVKQRRRLTGAYDPNRGKP
jgi:hypothetical protein